MGGFSNRRRQVRDGRARGGRGGAGARRAITLVEMIVAVLLIGAGLFLLVGWTRLSRGEMKARQARCVLAELDRALMRYFRAEGRYPAAAEDDPQAAVSALMRHPASKRVSEAIPESLWSTRRPRQVVDPWGTPLRYVSGATSRIVRVNKGRPAFVSAGPDRDFGDSDRLRIGDNLRSDDPGPEGFRESPAVDGRGVGAEDGSGMDGETGATGDAEAPD